MEASRYVDFGHDDFWEEVNPVVRAFDFPNKWVYDYYDEPHSEWLEYYLDDKYMITIHPTEDTIDGYVTISSRYGYTHYFMVNIEDFNLEEFNRQIASLQ